MRIHIKKNEHTEKRYDNDQRELHAKNSKATLSPNSARTRIKIEIFQRRSPLNTKPLTIRCLCSKRSSFYIAFMFANYPGSPRPQAGIVLFPRSRRNMDRKGDKRSPGYMKTSNAPYGT